MDTQVSKFLISSEKFEAGKLKHFTERWSDITGDEWIIDLISHAHIEFTETPVQNIAPRQYSCSKSEEAVIDGEIQKLLDKKVIKPANHCYNAFISTIFVRPKKDGTFIMILNLKNLNQYVIIISRWTR